MYAEAACGWTELGHEFDIGRDRAEGRLFLAVLLVDRRAHWLWLEF